MFRCTKCKQVIGPGITPLMVPTGFKTGPNIGPRAQRTGEMQLCAKCGEHYIEVVGEVTQDLSSYYFSFVNKQHEPTDQV